MVLRPTASVPRSAVMLNRGTHQERVGGCDFRSIFLRWVWQVKLSPVAKSYPSFIAGFPASEPIICYRGRSVILPHFKMIECENAVFRASQYRKRDTLVVIGVRASWRSPILQSCGHLVMTRAAKRLVRIITRRRREFARFKKPYGKPFKFKLSTVGLHAAPLSCFPMPYQPPSEAKRDSHCLQLQQAENERSRPLLTKSRTALPYTQQPWQAVSRSIECSAGITIRN